MARLDHRSRNDEGPVGNATRFAPLAQSSELRAASVGDVVVADCRARPGARLPWHAHEHANIVLLLDGSFSERFATRTLACASPVALYKPPAESHADEYGHAGARFVAVELLPSQIEQLRARGARLDDVRTVQDAEVVDLGMRLCRELTRLDAYSPLSIAGLVYELLAILSRNTRQDAGAMAPRWLRRVRERLHDEFGRRVSIADLAAEVHVHPDHLSRCFRRHYGVLIGDYVRQLRLQWAAEQLLASDATLAELALVAGFADQSDFTRRFRERFGTTPGRYRDALTPGPVDARRVT